MYSVFVISNMTLMCSIKQQSLTTMQCFKLKFSRSRLLATSFCKMVAASKILVAKKESVFKAGHLMSPYMK